MDSEVKHLQREILKTARDFCKAVIKSNRALLKGEDPAATALELHRKVLSELVVQTHQVMTRGLLDLDHERMLAARDRVIAEVEEIDSEVAGALFEGRFVAGETDEGFRERHGLGGAAVAAEGRAR